MGIRHCGKSLEPQMERLLKATPEEESRGVKGLRAREYNCSDVRCRKRLFYKQELFEVGQSEWTRVRNHQLAAFVRRLRLAKESDWVWGYHKLTFSKIKVTVE